MSTDLAVDPRPAATKHTFALYAIFIIAAGAVILALPMLINGAYPGNNIY